MGAPNEKEGPLVYWSRICLGVGSLLVGLMALLIGKAETAHIEWVDSFEMPFASSISFLFFGTLILILFRSPRLARFLSSMIILFSLVSICGAMFVQLEPDSIGYFVFDWIKESIGKPSHPSGGVGFLLLGLSSLMIVPGEKAGIGLAVSALLAGLCAVFGTISVVSMLVISNSIQQWQGFSELAPFTIVGICACGNLAFFYTWNRGSRAGFDMPVWGPMLLFLLGMLVTIMNYRSNMIDEIDRLHTRTVGAAGHFHDVFQSMIYARGDALERMARRMSLDNNFQADKWYDDAIQHMDDLPGLEAIGRTDPEGEVTFVKQTSDVALSHIKILKIISRQKKAKGFTREEDLDFSVSDSFLLQDEAVAFAITMPIFKDQEYEGLLFAILNPQTMFSTNIESIVLPAYNFQLSDDIRTIYSRYPEADSLGTQGVYDWRNMELGNQDWKLLVAPSQAYIKRQKSDLALRSLLGGTSIAGALAIMFFLMRYALLTSKESQLISNRLQSILDGAIRVSIVTIDLDGNVTSFNTGAERMLGYRADEVIGKLSYEKFHLVSELDEHAQMVGQEIGHDLDRFQAFTEGAQKGAFEERNWTYVRKTGKHLPVSMIVTAIKSQDNEVIGFLEIAVDITATEAKIRRYAKQLERTNQELQEFSYVASHDLKEPVRNLISYSTLLEEDLGRELPKDAKDDLFYIKDAARRMQRLVDDLLHLSRAGRSAMKRTELDLVAIIDEVEKSLATRIAETNATIEIKGELPKLVGDATLYFQLFMNLIGNALKFGRVGEDPVIKISARSSADLETIVINDNGIGMDEKYAKQIFLPFKRLHGMSKYEGTGIGLSICQKIVERHDGMIWVESKENEGATFYFSVPKSTEK